MESGNITAHQPQAFGLQREAVSRYRHHCLGHCCFTFGISHRNSCPAYFDANLIVRGNAFCTRRAIQADGQAHMERRSVCLQLHLADSIYLWACGEKADKDENDPKLADMFIGWLILLVQGFSYGMLIVLGRSTTSSDTSSTEDADSDGTEQFVLVSVTGAIYLLIVSTSHDLRAGFSLLVDGARAGHRAFGAGLLIVYGTMITSALTVLASTSNDSASLLLNAVAVLFIADLDEKALRFFSTIPQSWRLFWAMEFIGISFSLALIAVVSIGESFQVLGNYMDGFQGYPTWVIWVLNPTVVTISTYILSAGLYKWFESCSASLKTVDPLTFSSAVTRAGLGILAALHHTKELLRRQPVFYLVLGVWLVYGVYTEFYYVLVLVEPTTTLVFYLCLGEGFSLKICMNETGSTYPYIINAMLVAGVVMKALGRYLPRPISISELQEPCRSSEMQDKNVPVRWATESRLPSLLIGLGLGYWVSALLVILCSSWPNGGWPDPPAILSVVGYVCPPCFSLLSIFMMADPNVFGVKFGAVFKPAVDLLLDRRRIVYWVMIAVFRDAFVMWALVNIKVVAYFSQ